MKFGGRYKASWVGEAVTQDQKEPVMEGVPIDKLLENSLKLAKDDLLDGVAVIVITKEGEMQMAYRAKNAALLHLHAGRLMHEIQHDIFVTKQKDKRTLLA